MAGKPGEARKKSILLRLSILILILAGLFGTAFVVLRPVELAARNNMTEIVDKIIREAEKRTGRKLEYGSISPSIFGSLDIRDIRLVRDDNSPFLSIVRLRLSYSLWNLIRGKFDQGLYSVHLDHPVLSLDFAQDKALMDFFFPETGQGETPAFSGLTLENFRFRIRNGEWGAAALPGHFEIRNFNLDGFVRKDRIVFNSRWNAQGTLNPGSSGLLGSAGLSTAETPFSASMTGKANGDFSLSFTEGSAQVNIPSFSGDMFKLKPITVSFFLRDRKLEIRKVYDRLPADFVVTWDTRTKDISCSFLGENFKPQDLVTLTGSWKDYNSWLAMNLSGQASLRVNEKGADYSLDLSGAIGSAGSLESGGFQDFFPGSKAPGNLAFALAAAGDRDQIRIRNLYIDSGQGKIGYTGALSFKPLAPNGTLSLSGLTLREGGDAQKGINAALLITSRGKEIRVRGDNFSSGGVELSDLDLTLFREAGGWSFLCSALRAGEGSQGFSLEGSLDYRPQLLQTMVKLDSFPARDIIGLSAPLTSALNLSYLPQNIMDSVSVSSEVFLTVDNQRILYNAPRLVIAYEGMGGDIEASASLAGTDRRFELDQGEITWAGGRAGLSGYADFSNPRDINFSLEAAYGDLVYYAKGVVLDQRSLSLQGSYGLEVFFSPAGTYGYSGYAQAKDIPIPSGDRDAHLSFLVSARFDSPSFWSADIEYIDIIDIPANSSIASVRLAGVADQDGVWIPQVQYHDGLGLLSGNLSVSWDTAYRKFNFVGGINDAGGKEKYGLYAVLDREAGIEFAFNTEGMRLSRINRSFQNGAATGNLRVFWNSREAFQAELNLPSLTFPLGDRMVRGSAKAALDNSELSMRDIRVNYGGGVEAVLPYFRVNRSQGTASTEAQAWASPGGQLMEISLRGETRFAPIETWGDYREILDSIEGSLAFTTRQNNIETTEEPVNLVFSSVKDEKGNHISLEGGPRNMIRFRFTPKDPGGGNFYAALSAPSPVRGSFTGSMDSETIDLQVPDLYVDMASLWKFIPPQDVISFPDGIVTGSLRVAGPLRDPEFFGSAQATSLKIQVPQYVAEDIRPVPVLITLDGNEMTFGPISAAAGNGSGIASGSFQFTQWIPNIFSLDIQVPRETPVPLDFEIGGVMARGRASGDMNISMENYNLRVSGELIAQNTQISLSPSESAGQEIKDPRSEKVSTTVNMAIRTGRQVDFFWPSVEMPIIQASADLGTGLRVTGNTGTQRFSVVGDVMIRSGEIFYLDRNFYLRQGTLFFNESETRFEPRISARAEVRDQNADGPVTISMIIDNAPLHSFTPRFESNPSLSQVEILSLLGQFQSASPEDPNRDANAVIAFTADALSQFTVMRTLQREIRNYLGLDMFSFRTQAVQNVVLRGFGLQPTIEQDNRAGNYFDNTTIFFGKYLGADIFVESLFSLRYDPAKQEWGGIDLEPEVGLELRNPLFDIRMNVLLQHPENWFINDVTFSLTRKWFF